MRFVFDERKAAQAAALLLENHGAPMAYVDLVKLLYLVDRQSLVETGYPVTGDQMVCMDHGPVLSRVYDLNSRRQPAGSSWDAHISSPTDYRVSLKAKSDGMALSDYEAELVRTVYERYGHLDHDALVAFVRTLPEWRDPLGSSAPLDPRIILRAAGKSDEEIEQVADQVEAVYSFQNLGSLVG